MICPYQGCSGNDNNTHHKNLSCPVCGYPLIFCDNKNCNDFYKTRISNRSLSNYCRKCGSSLIHKHDWTCYRGDEQLSSSVNYDLSFTVTIRWHISLDTYIRAPLLLYRGLLFLTTMNGKIFVLNAFSNKKEGKIIAEISTGHNEENYYASYIINNKLFVPTYNSIYCIDLLPASTIKGSFKAELFTHTQESNQVFSSHLNCIDNTLVIRTTDIKGTKSHLCLIDISTRKHTSYSFSSLISFPVIKGSIIYFGDAQGHLYKITHSDKKLHKLTEVSITQGIDVHKSPTIMKDKLIYVDIEGYLYGYYYKTDNHLSNIGSAGGRHIKSFTAANERIIVGHSKGADVYNSFGINQFTITDIPALADTVTTDPLVANNCFIFGTQKGLLYIVSNDNPNIIKKIFIARSSISSNPAFCKNMIFVSSQNGEVKCIEGQQD